MTDLAVILGIITALITVVTAIINVIRTTVELEDKIQELQFKLEKKIDELDHHVDVVELTTNGCKELIGHSRERFKLEIDNVNKRIDMNIGLIEEVENFLQKNTAYEKRHR